MNIIFQINGGLGKCVAGTAICKSIKVKYPESKLIVIAGYPDVFLNNPNVDRCIRHEETKYFYRDFIMDKDFIFLGHEPYLENSYLKKECNLIETWCNLFDLPVVQNHGEIFLTKREVDFYARKYQFNKPILAIQTSGSGGELLYNWTRDLPPAFVKEIINKHKEKFDIVHIRHENQVPYDNTIPFTDNIRAVCVLLAISRKRIFMDSSCQHLAAALSLPSNVFWVTTSPKVFGYDMHNNIIANDETKPVSSINSFLHKYDLVGQLTDFPYNDELEIFNYETLDTLI